MHWTPTDPFRTSLTSCEALVPMQQHPHYAAACRALGTGVLSLALVDGGSKRATAQILIRRWPLFGRFSLLSRGPVWDPELDPFARRKALTDLVDALHKRFTGVMVTPELCDGADPLADAGLLEMVSPYHLAEIDLTVPEAARRAALDPKWRNRLNRAEALNLDTRVEPLPDDESHWLLHAEAAQARCRRYGRLPPRFSTAWARANSGAAKVFALYCNGKPAAGALILLHPPTASYHVGWTGPQGRAVSAHNLLLWQAGCWLAERGYRTLDLGNLDTESTPGLARFKLAAGGQPVRLGSTWMQAPGSAAVARAGRWLGSLPAGGAGRKVDSPDWVRAQAVRIPTRSP
ncbi:MAG: GNAT family N-acetyltransferase [Rhodobacteraceae bacterium]|nr:GNAT family N-acetyltransferase [Paracoccaceae bacterium]